MYISTHTLTWSVTGVPQTWGGDYHNFNSHAHVERDQAIAVAVLTNVNFNSHAHVERDSRSCFLYLYEKYFNSHAHVERDDDFADNCKIANISTHTLTWSVTADMRQQ